MARDAHDVEVKPLWEGMQKWEQWDARYCKRWRAVHDMCQNAQNKEVATQEFDAVRSKLFNVYSVKSFLLSKLRQKQSKSGMCELKLDKGSNGNLMPIRVYKMLSHKLTNP